MSLQEILDHRRAIRHYNPEKPLDPERVKECIRMATLAPTSSNMQLWEAYHVTDKAVLEKLAQEKRIKKWDTYYGKVMPFLYSRCFGLWGLLRKLLAQLIGLSRPIVRQVSEGDIRVVVHKSCALAAQTFMLAMSEAGYDTCPLEGFDSLLVKKTLGLPRKVEINMVITCGIRQPDGVWGDRYRQPFSETYHRV